MQTPLPSSSSPIPSNGHSLVDSIGSAGDDVVELVGHPSRARHVRHAPWSVELGGQDVVQHSSGVADLETARFDPSNLDG